MAQRLLVAPSQTSLINGSTSSRWARAQTRLQSPSQHRAWVASVKKFIYYSCQHPEQTNSGKKNCGKLKNWLAQFAEQLFNKNRIQMNFSQSFCLLMVSSSTALTSSIFQHLQFVFICFLCTLKNVRKKSIEINSIWIFFKRYS